MHDLDPLRYPIGHFRHKGPISSTQLDEWIDDIARLPGDLRELVRGLSDVQLDAPYRPDGWTIRQVIHHVPDSHLNCYVRFKWALTEDDPTIKTYDEARWAALHDYELPIDDSLLFLELLHAKWVALLRGLTPDQFARRFLHPEWGPTPLNYAVGSYAWHGRHHLAHIQTKLEREGWL